MKYVKVLVLAVLLISLYTPAAVKAEEGEYYLITENLKNIISFMNKEDMQVIDIYEDFSTVHASLNEREITKLRTFEPSLTIQQDKHYTAAVDTTRESMTKINAQPQNSSPFTGKQVKVGVLDSGIDTEHRDLKVIDGYCSLAPDCSTGIPYDDNNGHGTHVAGVIAALANGTGLIGIAPNVELYSIKVLDDLGAGSTSSIVQGIQWAIDKKLDIINLSITSTTDDPLIKKALEVAYSKGLIIVGAAGNQGKDTNNTVTFPAKYESVIAVGAVNDDLTSFGYSSQGSEVEIVAPGSQIFSTYPIEWDFVDGKQDGYRTISGTSMSAPHVTGVLALLKERFPTMTNVELRNLLGGMTKDLGAAGRDPIFGKGLLQYPKLIPGAPELIKQNGYGKVNLSLKSSDENVSITRNGIQVVQTNGSWSIYGVKGVYPIDMAYTTTNGIPVKERLNISIAEPAYMDVTANQWFSQHIGFLATKNQISGYLDGSFKPYQVITRAEAATLLGRALKYEGIQTETIFNDVSKSSFASGYIQKAVEAKIITGYEDGTFKPDKTVSRAEMAILIAKAFNLTTTTSTQNTFTDVSPSMAAYAYILPTIEAKVTKGYSDGTFRPYEDMTRSEFAVFLTRVQTDEIQ